MTINVNGLTWQSQANPSEPLAPATIDFSQDLTWTFTNLQGTYLQTPIFPRGVTVNNTQNKNPVTVTFGPQVAIVNAFDNAIVEFPATTQIVTFSSSVNPGTPITVDFFIKPPSGGGYNYAGATSVNQGILQQNINPITSTGVFNGSYSSTSLLLPTAVGGALLFSTAFTPKSAASQIKVSCQIKGSCGAADTFILALFNGATYIDHCSVGFPSGGALGNLCLFPFETTFASPGTALIQLNLRLGSNNPSNFILNGVDNGALTPLPGWTSWFNLYEIITS